jgi:alkylation response protein AidB-like acyl-CoA dehydrogenase
VIAWLDTVGPELAVHPDPGDLTGVDEGFERSLHAEAGRRGWLALPVEQQAVFNYEAARADAPVIDTAMTLAGTAVGRFATHDHHRRVLADMAAGRVEACVAYTETDAGTDLSALRGTAARGGDGWVLDATKSLLTGAHKADWCVTVLRTDPDAPARSAVSMFLVDLHASGVSIHRRPTLNGWTLDEIVFDSVRVGPEALLGVEGEGWRQMGEALAAERSGMFWLGFARHALDLLGHHVAHTTDDDGLPLADDPLVLDEVGRLEAEWASADLLSRRTLWSQLADTDVASATAMAKVVTTELLVDIAQAASEIAGPAGIVWAPLFSGDDIPDAAAGGRFAWEYLERIHSTLGAGVNEVHRDTIAVALLGRPSR